MSRRSRPASALPLALATVASNLVAEIERRYGPGLPPATAYRRFAADVERIGEAFEQVEADRGLSLIHI